MERKINGHVSYFFRERYSCKDTAVFPIERFGTAIKNYYEFLALVTLTYQDMVLLCWFAGHRVPCTNNGRYFNLAFTDLGSCFTFNEIRKPINESGILDKSLDIPGGLYLSGRISSAEIS
uniref:LAGLIDADG homing endonuclease n=1 Tax=Romanomermis culicivorax TaxID=13658 RepID=A0A915KFS6_ROMCU